MLSLIFKYIICRTLSYISLSIQDRTSMTSLAWKRVIQDGVHGSVFQFQLQIFILVSGKLWKIIYCEYHYKHQKSLKDTERKVK